MFGALCRSPALPRAAAVQVRASLPLRPGPPPRISHRADVRCFAATAAIGLAMPPKSKAKAKATQKRPAPKAGEGKPKKAAKKEEAATPLNHVDVDESKAAQVILELRGSCKEGAKAGSPEWVKEIIDCEHGRRALGLVFAAALGLEAALSGEFEKDYFAEIAKFVQQERARGPVHPPADKAG
ncbi:hypothetical protein AK812_SmicGene2877 [Symbiodinium microadriaticum]|uniref:Uncharacterized protein n=1 Tax=Symbiodinium microadriaticum TaxID=2951 RepID=A0A1Q9F0G6_SYMMI|nr:hypothetical protein AK812_SmicGene2877 [Symbiodinium microadriaticum]